MPRRSLPPKAPPSPLSRPCPAPEGAFMSSSEPLLLFRRAPAALNRAGLRAFARRLRDQVAGGRSFCCLIADDRELCRLNAQFLGKNNATDVLSFPQQEPADFLGE